MTAPQAPKVVMPYRIKKKTHFATLKKKMKFQNPQENSVCWKHKMTAPEAAKV
jgi:hypothetical protein